jgi:hypothetical protein
MGSLLPGIAVGTGGRVGEGIGVIVGGIGVVVGGGSVAVDWTGTFPPHPVNKMMTKANTQKVRFLLFIGTLPGLMSFNESCSQNIAL